MCSSVSSLAAAREPGEGSGECWVRACRVAPRPLFRRFWIGTIAREPGWRGPNPHVGGVASGEPRPISRPGSVVGHGGRPVRHGRRPVDDPSVSRRVRGVPGDRRGGPVGDSFLLVVDVEVAGRGGEGLQVRQRSTTRPSSSAMALTKGRVSSPSGSPDMRPPTAIITSTTRSGSSSTVASQYSCRQLKGQCSSSTEWA